MVIVYRSKVQNFYELSSGRTEGLLLRLFWMYGIAETLPEYHISAIFVLMTGSYNEPGRVAHDLLFA